MKFFKLILLISTTFLIIWIIGIFWFVQNIASYERDVSTKTDAIIVLAGGSYRVAEGISMLYEGLSEKLFISGVGKNVKVKEIYHLSDYSGADKINMIVKTELGYEAGSTAENAKESGKWIRDNNIKFIRLVTSNYHMPRSLLEFKTILDSAKIIPHVVNPEKVILEKWWRYGGTRDLIISEYNKFLAVAVFQHMSAKK